jgi:4-amino-4-deoxy-L-arabinose transferase-like glycosyltransferase
MSVIEAMAIRTQRRALAVPTLAVPVALYALAIMVRLFAINVVTFPLNEGSAYYVAVARNLVAGRGPGGACNMIDAPPPLNLPRQPACEMWQPLASVLAAWPMTLFGPGLASAQLGFAAAGALLAPLAWLVARDAARRLELPDNRQRYVALGAGLVAAVAGPFVLTAAIPDSTLPFTVLAVAACVVMPTAVKGNTNAVLAVGLLLGLAYLTRMEAIYLGVVFVGLAWLSGVRGRSLAGRIGAVAVVGGLVVAPWWLRNVAVFGTPMPGQLADNAFMTANEQIFNYLSRPTLADFVAQGPATIAAHIGQALWHDFVDVLLLPGNFVVAGALLTIVVGWRRWRALAGSALAALLAYGAIAFVVTSVVFPVATLWGTFEHAAGPLLVGFAVLAVIGGDALVARIRGWRAWPRPNAGMAPAALTAVVLAMAVLQVVLAGVQARARQVQISGVAAAVRDVAASDDALISDRPLWLGAALNVPTLALPRDGSAAVAQVAQRFGADLVVMVDGDDGATGAVEGPCFEKLPVVAPADAPKLAVMRLTEQCR